MAHFSRRTDQRPAATIRSQLKIILSLLTDDYVQLLAVSARHGGLTDAVRLGDTGTLFNWIVARSQLQGISDYAAASYVDRHGTATFEDLSSSLKVASCCSKLRSYWTFSQCRYRREAASCAQPDLVQYCTLPVHPFRNGRLSQSAYSLFLFMRDVCGGDFVGWIDTRLAEADDGSPRRHRRMRNAILEPMTNIYGVGAKVLSMALSDLLLGAGRDRERWITAGASMIAIDTLVHNFLHRTGIVHRHGGAHPYGAACYGADGCAEVIEKIADHIDARDLSPEYPQRFPRLIQHAIWSYCAAQRWNICNGNNIDDRRRCENVFCPAFSACERIALNMSETMPPTCQIDLRKAR